MRHINIKKERRRKHHNIYILSYSTKFQRKRDRERGRGVREKNILIKCYSVPVSVCLCGVQNDRNNSIASHRNNKKRFNSLIWQHSFDYVFISACVIWVMAVAMAMAQWWLWIGVYGLRVVLFSRWCNNGVVMHKTAIIYRPKQSFCCRLTPPLPPTLPSIFTSFPSYLCNIIYLFIFI